MTGEQVARSQQFGTERFDFAVREWRGFVLLPTAPAPASRPWVWYAPTFVNDTYPLPKQLHAWYSERLLAAGIHVAGVDVGESWGSPAGRAGFSAFHRACTERFGLADETILWPQSRGGLQCYNWAAERPECVRAIGGIYVLVNLAGLRLADARLHAGYGMDEETFRAHLPAHNPLERLAPLAARRIPLFSIHGDCDAIVPLEENAGELTRRYRALGGPAELVVLPGLGHAEVPPFFTSQALLDFFLRHAG